MVILKGTWSPLILLLAATLVMEASCQCLLRNRRFYKEHYDFPKSHFSGNYCDGILKQRGLTKSICTRMSTFIHAPKKYIEAVCEESGKIYKKGQRTYRKSKGVFSVTICKLRKCRDEKLCSYDVTNAFKYIVIFCRKGRPVHLEETQN